MRQLFRLFLVLIVVAIVVAIAGILLAGREGGGALPRGPSVLVWRVAEPVPEHVEQGFLALPGRDEPPSLSRLWRAFRGARRDPGVAGVVVYVQDASFGFAKAQELRRQLRELAAAGKFVDCYLETAGEGSNGTLEYYLATACDTIHLAPPGDLNLLGLYLDAPFLRGTLDKLRIHPDFAHVGRYKSAAETFTSTEHSPAAEEALGAVLDSEYGQIVRAIAEARELSPERVRELVDGAPYAAEEARTLGLVDTLAYPDELRDTLTERLGSEPRFVPILDYDPPGEPLSGRTVAVLFATGTIVRGSGGLDPWTGEVYLGSDELAESLRELAEDDAVDAVVLRVDSPGGSALASDLMLREVERLRQRKPVVVSMSDLAASGGYYLAARATAIVAEPGTLTGSIGVVSGKFVTSGLETELLGISHDPLQRGANAGIYAPRQPFTPQQAARVAAQMERVYATFVDHVAAGRKLPREQVLAIAEGRVWTGEDALRIGLVDALGGLDEAVSRARDAAGIPAGTALRLRLLPRPQSFLELLFNEERRGQPLSLEALTARLDPPGQALELPRAWRRLAAPW